MGVIIESLTMSYGKKKALDSVSLSIEPGVVSLLGPNGAGKTTLIRILSTLESRYTGNVSYGDISWRNPEKVRRIIGYAPQKFSIYPFLTVYEFMKMVCILKGTEAKEVNMEIERCLSATGMNDYRDKAIRHLSGGMVQRIGIAQAIVGNPKIVIFDEPTAGLDPEERIRFRKLLSEFASDVTVIVSTHIVADVVASEGTIIILDNGRLVACGTAQQLQKAAIEKATATNSAQMPEGLEECYVLLKETQIL